MELCKLQENEVNTARAQFMRIYDRQQEKMKELREMKTVMQILPPERKIQFLSVVKAITGTPAVLSELKWCIVEVAQISDFISYN